MASFTKQSGKHCARVRIGDQDIFQGGFQTKTDAKAWSDKVEASLKATAMKRGLGPYKTSFAVALRDYAYDVLVYQEGCVQAISRINKYMRAARLPELLATKTRGGRVFGSDAEGNIDAAKQKVKTAVFELTERTAKAPRFQGPQQAAFLERERANDARNALPQAEREKMARLAVSKIATFNLEELMNAMNVAGYKDATRRQELAILSGFFTHAKKKWRWPIVENPALDVTWPVGDKRNRILETAEQARLVPHLLNCQNKTFQIFVLFAMETAMRKDEMLSTACWCDVKPDVEEGHILKLVNAKGGKRDVPLTPFALNLLEQLPRGADHDCIFDITVSAVDCAWARVCKNAGIVDLHIHDLRHTAATMYAQLLNGDIFSLQQITGHKTLEILRLYVNKTVKSVAQRMQEFSVPTVAHSMFERMHTTRIDEAPKAVAQGAPVGMSDGAQGGNMTVGNVVYVGAFKGRAVPKTRALASN